MSPPTSKVEHIFFRPQDTSCICGGLGRGHLFHVCLHNESHIVSSSVYSKCSLALIAFAGWKTGPRVVHTSFPDIAFTLSFVGPWAWVWGGLLKSFVECGPAAGISFLPMDVPPDVAHVYGSANFKPDT